MTKIVKKAFPDSKKFQCGPQKQSLSSRYKALAPHYMDKILQAAHDGPVIIMMDESNKWSDDKACTILVRTMDPVTFRVFNRFLGMPICNILIGANLFGVLEATLLQYNHQ